DGAVGGGAGGVEVAQGGVAPAVGAGVVGQGVLDRQLRIAVGVDGLLRLVLGDGHALGDPVGGAGAGGDEGGGLGPPQRVRGLGRVDEVVLVIPGGVAHRLADQGGGREVDDRLDPVGHQGVVEPLHLRQVADDEAIRGHGGPVAGGQVVVDPDVVA